MTAPIASGWSGSPGGACTHWKAPPCHGAHPKAVDAAAWLSVALTVRVTDELSTDPNADLKRAERLAEQALAASPDSALAHYAKGQVLRAQSRCREAIPEFERAIALDPSRCRLMPMSVGASF
jgi:tetratricopeptide (TPR) repeat protein